MWLHKTSLLPLMVQYLLSRDTKKDSKNLPTLSSTPRRPPLYYVVCFPPSFSFNPFLFIRGLSCPSSVQASLILNSLKLTMPGFPYNCLPVSSGDMGFLKKIIGLVLAWKSGLGVPLLPLGPFCPLQKILLSEVGYADSNGRLAHFFQFEARQTVISFYSQQSRLSSKFELKTKCAKRPLLFAEGCHTQLDKQHCPENISRRFFKAGETL
jgi:hypothetical protein